jgi:TPP-dependent pyruvate/acetoin dehydrogenase alpha subunit
MYRMMLTCRRAEAMRAQASVAGHEAMIVGSTVNLQRGDVIAHPRAQFVAALLHGDGLHASGGTGMADLTLATGAAVGFKLHKQPNVVLAFCEGTHPEGVRYAARHKLPVVYVARSSQSAAPKLEITAVPVDGNDVVAVYRVAKEGLHRARIGDGPTLIECIFDAPAFLDGGWERSDPLNFLQQYLESYRLWSEDVGKVPTSATTARTVRAMPGFAVV